MNPILEMLDNNLSESDLLEDIYESLREGDVEKAKRITAKIEALRDLKFTLKKLIKEENL
jgi:uncharacterized protein (DUF433 family)